MKSLMCFGDSNTHGTVPIFDLTIRERYEWAKRWPGVLAAALSPDWRVIEEGHPGRTTVHDDPIEGAHKNGSVALPALLESHQPLDLVIIMLGTNDLKARFSVTAFDIALSVEKLIGKIYYTSGAANLSPLIAIIAPPPITERGVLAEMFNGGAAKSKRLGEHFAEIAHRNNCAFLDAGETVEISEIDGVHLDEKAHAELGARVAQFVIEKFQDRN